MSTSDINSNTDNGDRHVIFQQTRVSQMQRLHSTTSRFGGVACSDALKEEAQEEWVKINFRNLLDLRDLLDFCGINDLGDYVEYLHTLLSPSSSSLK